MLLCKACQRIISITKPIYFQNPRMLLKPQGACYSAYFYSHLCCIPLVGRTCSLTSKLQSSSSALKHTDNFFIFSNKLLALISYGSGGHEKFTASSVQPDLGNKLITRDDVLLYRTTF